MADGVDITAGSGTKILTDDTGAPGHAQVVKLAYSADGVATLIDADVNGLAVKLSTSTNTQEIVGDVAEDAVLAGNPVRIGGRASTARPTAMSAAGDIVTPWFDLAGALHTVPGAATTSTLANVTSSASNVTIRAASTSRKGLIVFNDSTSYLYLKFGTTASTTSFTHKIPPGGVFTMTGAIYTGAVDGIWSAANGAARVTELT